MEMGFGFMAAKIVYAAAELRIVDALAGEPQTSEALAAQTRTHGPSLRRLLRALAGLGIVAESGPDRFEITDLAAPLREGVPGSMHGLVTRLCGPDHWRGWNELVASVRTGETAFTLAHGVTWLESHERDPKEAAAFNAFMAETTRDVAPSIIAGCDFTRFDAVADLGGADGTLIAEILRAHTHLRGVLFDLPVGLTEATETLAAAGVADRCRVVSGDIFATVPDGVDAYVRKFILHDWDDEHATTILGNCRAAMSPEGRVLIIERVLPDRITPTDADGGLADILMLVATGGQERTERELRDLLARAGFTATVRTEPLPPFNYRVIEGTPADARRS